MEQMENVNTVDLHVNNTSGVETVSATYAVMNVNMMVNGEPGLVLTMMVRIGQKLIVRFVKVAWDQVKLRLNVLMAKMVNVRYVDISHNKY